MSEILAPEVRLQFARRLKTMRTQRGFERARYFARSLGIEENRYTRYERAEVEPSLTLIHKMCETLRVSPNELLGFAEGDFLRAIANPEPAFAEQPLGEFGAADDGVSLSMDAKADSMGALAWNLASEAVAIRHDQGGAKVTDDPLVMLQEKAALFRGLQSDPFAAATQILADRGLKDVDPKRKARLAELIQAFTDRASQESVARRPR
jgi:transcriptional regulator with XRE-family HTH domain